MKITNLSIRRPVTTTMVMVATLMIGIFSLLQLPLELYPTLDLPVAAVTTAWAGASPQEVDKQVTQPIVQQLQSLSGVSEIDSTSTQGSSQVVVLFNYGVDIRQQVDQMRTLVNRVQNQLPSDASAPVVQQFDPSNRPILTISLSGDEPLSALTDSANNIVLPALQHLNGVGAVNVAGGLDRQINVLVNPDRLNFYHLSISQVVQALTANNLSTDAGQVSKGSLLIPLHIAGQVSSPSEIMDIPIQTGQGTITVGDVAQVQDGYADVSMISTLDGKPSVSLSVVQASDANTVKVSDEVLQTVARLSHQLPKTEKLTVLSDSAQTIRDTIHTVVDHTILGFILGVLVMLLILRSIRTTTVIAVAIPIAVLATFIPMWAGGITINSVTLGSLAVGLGSLVDFSIVVLESIFRARQRGLDPMEAARTGTAEVGLAVLVAAMAQVCVFAPAIFTPGIAGQFFRPIALTVSFSHVAALVVAITFTPVLASRLLKGPRFQQEDTIPGKTAPFRAWNPFDWFARGMYDLTRAYRRVLNWGLNHRFTVIAATVVMLLASYMMVPVIGFELVPRVNTNQLGISINLPNGTSLDRATQVANQIADLAKQKMPGVQSIFEQVGGGAGLASGSTNTASITVTLRPDMQQTALQVAHDFQKYVANMPGIQVTVSPVSPGAGPVSGGVTVTIEGPDPNTLKILSDQVASIMKRTPGLQYVQNSLEQGTPDYQLNLNPAALARYHLTAQQVETALRQSFQGVNTSTFYQNGKEYDIVVKLPEDFSRNIGNLSQILITNSQGQAVPLQQVGTLTVSQEPPRITDINGVQSVTVQADVYGTSPGQVQRMLSQQFSTMRIPEGYSVGFGQQGQFMNSAFISLGLALLASVVLLYMVMASLFESFLTPFVIMFSLPPTFIGAALGLLLTHRSLNINSIIGVVMVMGLIANNAIVLVDYTNQLRAKGRTLREALLEAGPIRLRPILMSTLTTVLAMFPLVLGYGTGAESLASMATVIAFGLMFSTLVTLVLVPVMYVTTENAIQRVKKWFVRRGVSAHTTSSAGM
ncbi:efflux RND transporter permease subunit [Alicyclobacillus macrosporangiidus]|uniref:Hydrophobic/amphiphilic exporter-1, HAE1 family n=1 Tax=Alicyclobacillus macrosporangiidus TaxID=392015 RepID=A0A1I7JGQ1_9BACL|nr:efflux RND transporter permease subunit [Alicyclobacillus macrosporangiidus]SFU84346.1 hydrophobic/amphiphilic exporter-1, HAE1 family [Alicyclobacillus macrosporangiidus]